MSFIESIWSSFHPLKFSKISPSRASSSPRSWGAPWALYKMIYFHWCNHSRQLTVSKLQSIIRLSTSSHWNHRYLPSRNKKCKLPREHLVELKTGSRKSIFGILHHPQVVYQHSKVWNFYHRREFYQLVRRDKSYNRKVCYHSEKLREDFRKDQLGSWNNSSYKVFTSKATKVNNLEIALQRSFHTRLSRSGPNVMSIITANVIWRSAHQKNHWLEARPNSSIRIVPFWFRRFQYDLGMVLEISNVKWASGKSY